MSSLLPPEEDVVRSPSDLRLFTRPALKQRKAREICEYVRELIVSGKLKPGSQLPPEVELAEAFGVSRNTLRDSLNILHQEGTILRRHGVGTFVTRQLLVPNRLDVNLSTTELIRSTGWEPGDAEIHLRTVEADDDWADVLDTSPGALLIEVERVRIAGEKRVVYSLDRFPARLLELGRPPMGVPDVERFLLEQKSMYQLLEHRLGLSMAYGVATIKPATADAQLAERLHVPEGTQLMFLAQTDYNAGGQPLLASREYHLADVYSFTVYRKR
jgi:DNA-binding GntR family transcriptional regulator